MEKSYERPPMDPSEAGAHMDRAEKVRKIMGENFDLTRYGEIAELVTDKQVELLEHILTTGEQDNKKNYIEGWFRHVEDIRNLEDDFRNKFGHLSGH